MTATPQVSIVIPLGSRHADLTQLCEGLQRVLTPLIGHHEIIFIDDATGPETRQALAAARARYPEIRIIRLQRPMGESMALAVGTQSAHGQIIATIDPYLSVSLDELPKLLTPVLNGTDLVWGWRSPRQEKGLGLLASQLFNAAAAWLTKIPVHDLNCRMRVMRREVLVDLPVYGDLHRFLPIFAARRGYTWCEVQVPQQKGTQEVGAYDLRSYVGRLLDLFTLAFLTRFVKRPLHFFGLIGLVSFAIGAVLGSRLMYDKLVLDRAIGHRPLLLLAVLLIVVGIQVASIGLLGELMIFTHARDLKEYVVQEDLT